MVVASSLEDIDAHESDTGESFALAVTTLSGETMQVEGLTPGCTISELCRAFASQFGCRAEECCHEPHELGQLYDGLRLLSNMDSTLVEAGLQEGVVLTYIWTSDLVALRLAKGDTLKVKRHLACECDMLKDAMVENGEHVKPLPDGIDARALSKALEYVAYHIDVPAQDIQRPLRSTDLSACGVSAWDAQYIAVPQEALIELILVAKALDMQALLSLACAKVASLINGKNTKEIRKQFNTQSLRRLRRIYVSHSLTPWATGAISTA